jgi:hypothetical protein
MPSGYASPFQSGMVTGPLALAAAPSRAQLGEQQVLRHAAVVDVSEGGGDVPSECADAGHVELARNVQVSPRPE